MTSWIDMMTSQRLAVKGQAAAKKWRAAGEHERQEKHGEARDPRPKGGSSPPRSGVAELKKDASRRFEAV